MEKNSIRINDQQVDYILKRSKRAKRLRLSVHRDASVVMTLPMRASRIAGERFMIEKAAWLLGKILDTKAKRDSSPAELAGADYARDKKKAAAFIKERVSHFARLYDYRYERIFIRNQKTRWGSCSAKRNLNFNFKLFALPQPLADYVIVHELCHLEEMNHSAAFWKLVAKIFPDYRELRKELKAFAC